MWQMSKNDSHLGQIIRAARLFNGLTQSKIEELSRKFFHRKEAIVPAESLRKIESKGVGGERQASEARLRSIAQILRIYPEDFLLEQAGVFPNQLAARLIRYPDLHPPFDLDIALVLYLQVRARADLLQGFLPSGVTLRNRHQEPKIGIRIQQLREATAGRHAECTFEVPVTWERANCTLVLSYFGDSPAAICALREIYGYPAKLGHPEFRTGPMDNAEAFARLTVSGLPLFTVTAVDTFRRDSERNITALERRLVWKKVLNPDGVTYAVDQLVSFLPVEGQPLGSPKMMTFNVQLKFQTNVFSALWGIKDGQIGLAAYIQNVRMTMPPGTIEVDHRASPAAGAVG